MAARSICDGRCWVSSSWTGRAPGPNRDDHHALRRPRPTRRPTVHGSRKSAGRVSFIYIISHLTVTFSSSSAVGATPRPAPTRDARGCRLVTFRLSILSRRRLSCPGGKLMTGPGTGQHRQPKARTTPRRPGTPMYTDQCCEDMLKARTPHTTMQNAPKAKAENAADQSMPKRGLWESNEAAISPETMRRGCQRERTQRCPRSAYRWAEVPFRISGPERAQGLTPSARRVLSASSPSDIRRGRVAQHAGAAEEAVADDRLARKLGLRPV